MSMAVAREQYWDGSCGVGWRMMGGAKGVVEERGKSGWCLYEEGGDKAAECCARTKEI
jgi:hypothetical protein